MALIAASGGEDVWKARGLLRERAPVIQCINDLSSTDMRTFGDIIIATGATPIVTLGTQIIPKSMKRFSGLCIGAGRLSLGLVSYMKDAIVSARLYNKPCVLDLVGAGITKDRTLSYVYLTNLTPSVIRGPASVIRALAPNQDEIGEDKVKNAIITARMLALASKSVVNVCGKSNFVTDGHRVILVHNGKNLINQIPETCRAVSVMIAAFAAVDPSRILDSTAWAIALFGLALEMGMEKLSSSSSSGNSVESSYLEDDLILYLEKINEQQCREGVRMTELQMKHWKY